MPYRQQVITNAQGEPEAFLVRISEEAVSEWLGARDRLRGEGSPDRPPDVDTETLRGWIQHPGEEAHPYFAGVAYTRADTASRAPKAVDGIVAQVQATVLFVGVFVHSDADGNEIARVRVSVEGAEGSGYVLRFTMWQPGATEPEDTAHVWQADAPDELVNADLQHLLELGSIFEDAKITLPSDILTLDAEYEAAFADLDALYNSANEAPTPRLVQ